MSDNKRQFPRQEIQIEVELSFLDKSPRTIITHDLSQGGLSMRLSNTEDYPMGEMVHIQYKNLLWMAAVQELVHQF